MTKVAIIIPTMNRPDFILRQLEFYELMKSPHPVYISDSSNEENAEKIKNGIKKYKSFEITYQWAPPGKDCLYQLFALIKEKYCIQMGDDDIMIPKTISECADFLETHPDYGTCSGKQVNIRFRTEDYNMPYGIIARQTLLIGRSIDEDDMLVRAKNFWFNTNNMPFISFAVRKTEVERSLRNITKHFSLMEHMTEFLIMSILITSGKLKVLDKLGYIMQVSDNRYDFDHDIVTDFILSLSVSDRWKISQDGLSVIIQEKGFSREESLKIVRWLFILNLVHKFSMEAEGLPIGRKPAGISDKKPSKKLRNIISKAPFIKKIYYKFNSPTKDITRPESIHYNDFKTVKDFLEKNIHD